MVDLDAIRFVPARWFTDASRAPDDVRVVVIHDMEYPERATAAEDVARYFQTTDRKVSAHFNVDADSIVQCVALTDVAWAAPGCNHDGVQIELAGYARQTREQWLDPYGVAMLGLAAELCASLLTWAGLAAVFVDAAGLTGGGGGITTHAEVSRAYRRSDHYDPGGGFPLAMFMQQVVDEMTAPAVKPWPVPIPAWFWPWARWRLGGRQGQRPHTPAGSWQGQTWREGEIPAWAWARLEAIVANRGRA